MQFYLQTVKLWSSIIVLELTMFVPTLIIDGLVLIKLFLLFIALDLLTVLGFTWVSNSNLLRIRSPYWRVSNAHRIVIIILRIVNPVQRGISRTMHQTDGLISTIVRLVIRLLHWNLLPISTLCFLSIQLFQRLSLITKIHVWNTWISGELCKSIVQNLSSSMS